MLPTKNSEEPKNTAKNLCRSQYKEEEGKVVVLSDLFERDGMEIEDLMPYQLIKRYIDIQFSTVEDEEFAEVYDEDAPIVDQIEEFASKHNIDLEPGKWKVDMAKSFKRKLLSGADVSDEILDRWEKLFSAIVAE